MPTPRADGRQSDQLRPISFESGIAPHATGSVLVSFGATQVICAATIENNVPTWMKQQKVPGGWLTAEYSMLPYSTHDRKPREISKGKPDGRNIEIQRLIGRSLRAVLDLQKLGPNTLWIDCDVLQADGGTRTASITGAYLAARLAVQKLLGAGLLHDDLLTVAGADLSAYAATPRLTDDKLDWAPSPVESRDDTILRPAAAPFAADGGMRLLTGNLGRAIIKTSAVAEDYLTIEAPVRIFTDQESVQAAFKAGELDRDVIVVVRFQGPRANGMPELHKLTPALGVLLDRGHKVALVTDGRMSGASGKVPAAIHLSPESLNNGPIGKLRDGDVVRLCARTGELTAVVDPADWAARAPASAPTLSAGTGRELFAFMRAGADNAEHGASAMLAAAGL